MLVGVDEAGCGPACGSLWAAAACLQTPIQGLADSKTLSEKRRMALRASIVKDATFGLGEVTKDEIDTINNLFESRRLAFERALDAWFALTATLPEKIIVDGSVFRPWRNVPYECHDHADADYPCVSAASILAKTQRDEQIYALCRQRPELDERYQLSKNKGYLSRAHISGLMQHGRSDVHRNSFHIKAIDGPR